MSVELPAQIDINPVDKLANPQEVEALLQEYCTDREAVGFGTVRLQALVNYTHLLNVESLGMYEGARLAKEHAEWIIEKSSAEDPTGEYEREHRTLQSLGNTLRDSHIRRSIAYHESQKQYRRSKNEDIDKREVTDEAERSRVYTFESMVRSAFEVSRQLRDGVPSEPSNPSNQTSSDQ